MARATNAVARKRRKKKVLKEAKGYFGRKHSSYRLANEQVMRSGAYAYRDRRKQKREVRGLRIIRMNPAPLDHPDQRCRPPRGAQLLTAHARVERGRRRGQPQDARGRRRARSRGVS